MSGKRIAAIVGWGRTMGCVASHIEAELYEPGRLWSMVQKGGSHYAVFRIGEVHGRVTKRGERVEISARPENVAELQ